MRKKRKQLVKAFAALLPEQKKPAVEVVAGDENETDYQRWVRLYDRLTPEDEQLIRKKSASLSYKPLFSVLMPIFNHAWRRS